MSVPARLCAAEPNREASLTPQCRGLGRTRRRLAHADGLPRGGTSPRTPERGGHSPENGRTFRSNASRRQSKWRRAPWTVARARMPPRPEWPRPDWPCVKVRSPAPQVRRRKYISVFESDPNPYARLAASTDGVSDEQHAECALCSRSWWKGWDEEELRRRPHQLARHSPGELNLPNPAALSIASLGV